MGWRVTEEVEINGIDLAVHGETAYETLGGARRTATGDLTGAPADSVYGTTGGSARVTTEAK